MRISDWSSDVFSSDLGTIPDADLAPVIARRDIVERHVLFGMAALAVDARPVGVRHHRDAGVDDPADHRDMAEAELGRFGEHDHRADAGCVAALVAILGLRSEEHTSELQSLMRISYAVLCLKKKITQNHHE